MQCVMRRLESHALSDLASIHIRHSRDKGVAHEFTSADRLLKDFFEEVDRVLEGVRK